MILRKQIEKIKNLLQTTVERPSVVDLIMFIIATVKLADKSIECIEQYLPSADKRVTAALLVAIAIVHSTIYGIKYLEKQQEKLRTTQ